IVLRESLAELDQQTERVERLDKHLQEQLKTLPPVLQQIVGALVCLHGVQELTALTVVSETGDLSRFAKAQKLFSYAGVVPREHSSGGPDKSRRGGITKAGNAHLRRVLIEAAWHYRHPPKSGAAVSKRRAGKDPALVQLCQKAHRRLHDKYRRLL